VAESGRERVQAALAMDMADRPPVSAWGHTYDQEWDVQSLAVATVDLARRHHLDFVKLQIRASSFAEAFGAEWRYSGSAEAEPLMASAAAAVPAAWERIAAGPNKPKALADQVETLRRVASEVGRETPVIQTVFSPGMVAWFLAGRDTGLLERLVAERPDLVAAALESIAQTLAGFSEDSLNAGAAGVFYAINPLADSTVITPADYRRTYLKSDRIAFAGAAGGWFNMLHLCSGHIDLGLAEQLAPHCLNWSIEEPGNPALAAARDRLAMPVAGGVNRYAPIRATVAEIRAEADAAMAATGGRGLLLTTGCSASPWSEVREENLAAMFEAAAA
jgi:uroporphyrinogen decarboxylase